MISSRSLYRFLFLAFAGTIIGSCQLHELDILDELDTEWIKKCVAHGRFEVQQILKTGSGIENKYQGFSAQGVTVRDDILYRLYDTGICQTFDITNLSNPVKLATFELGSHKSSNHSNCAQGDINDNGDYLIYVSGLNGGKTYVEQVSSIGSELIQTITLPRLSILNETVSLNCVCGDDGYLWYFGAGGDKLIFAKARKPAINEGDVVLNNSDIYDYWSEDGYVYEDDVWQGGKVYQGYLFMVFGAKNCKRHLAIYDTSSHLRVMDIDLSETVYEEPEDCEIIPEGIIIVTNGGEYLYLIRPIIN